MGWRLCLLGVRGVVLSSAGGGVWCRALRWRGWGLWAALLLAWRGCWLVSGYTRDHPILVAYRAAEAASGPGVPTRGPGTFSYICSPLHPTHPSINQRRLPLVSWTLKPSPNSRASWCIVVSSPTASQHTRATTMGEVAAELPTSAPAPAPARGAVYFFGGMAAGWRGDGREWHEKRATREEWR